ncbi:hypothetical protein RKD25_000266 [Streptomyces sp. SAI-124]
MILKPEFVTEMHWVALVPQRFVLHDVTTLDRGAAELLADRRVGL